MTGPIDLHWLYNPLTLYAALALSLVACLLLFLSIKRELARMAAQAGEAVRSSREEIGGLRADLEGTRQAVREIENSPATPIPGQSLNLAKRAQALRMHRRGETVPTIAAALQTPQNEIALALKIHRLLNGTQS